MMTKAVPVMTGGVPETPPATTSPTLPLSLTEVSSTQMRKGKMLRKAAGRSNSYTDAMQSLASPSHELQTQAEMHVETAQPRARLPSTAPTTLQAIRERPPHPRPDTATSRCTTTTITAWPQSDKTVKRAKSSDELTRMSAGHLGPRSSSKDRPAKQFQPTRPNTYKRTHSSADIMDGISLARARKGFEALVASTIVNTADTSEDIRPATRHSTNGMSGSRSASRGSAGPPLRHQYFSRSNRSFDALLANAIIKPANTGENMEPGAGLSTDSLNSRSVSSGSSLSRMKIESPLSQDFHLDGQEHDMHSRLGPIRRVWGEIPEEGAAALDGEDFVVDVDWFGNMNRSGREKMTYWPLDLLPTSCPNVRVMTWGFETLRDHDRLVLDQDDLFFHARRLLDDLNKTRDDTHPSRELAFVAHSTGGIILKEVS